MSNRYYIDYPRDFANEYTVYVVEPKRANEFEAQFPRAIRITRADAIDRGIRRPRQAERNSEQWFGGLAETSHSEYLRDHDLRDDPATDSELLYYAAGATNDILDEREN